MSHQPDPARRPPGVDAHPAADPVDRARELARLLTDPAVTTSPHARTAADLAHHLDDLLLGDTTTNTTTGSGTGPTTAPTSAPALADGAATDDLTRTLTRGAMVLRAVSDAVRGAAEAQGRAARRLPPAARPGGDLTGAPLRRADLRSAPLRGARLTGADLREADLRGADLLGADLSGARAEGADLSGALFLTQAQVDSLVGDRTTRLPARLHRPRHWG